MIESRIFFPLVGLESVSFVLFFFFFEILSYCFFWKVGTW